MDNSEGAFILCIIFVSTIFFIGQVVPDNKYIHILIAHAVEESDTSGTHFLYRQLNFPSEPGVANEILENEAKSC